MRLPGKGETVGALPVRVAFDGVEYGGLQGEPLAATLLANDVRLMGRSFKYHRPRGVLTAGSEEPNALVTVLNGAKKTPNVRATTQEVYDGLRAVSQNRWPSLDVDVLSLNDLAAPFLSAGFYYKTFMWPKAFWEKVYEPFIRRAAGLGALSGKDDEQPYEQAFAFCDLLVIGAGPAGLMAALTAAQSGADVILCDEQSRPGGRLLSDGGQIDGQPAADWADGAVETLRAMPNVRVMTRTTVTGAYDGGIFGALEQVSRHVAPRDGLPRECFWRITAERAVLAAGALERPIAFANNDRPGIMMASALRTYAHRWGVVPGKTVTLFGANNSVHHTAMALQDLGVEIAGVIDPREDAEALGDYRVFKAGRVIGTKGRKGLSAVTIKHAGGTKELPTECLGMSGGWNPSVHLTCHMGGRPTWDADSACFLPKEGAVSGLSVAGAARGRWTTAACLADGVDVARAVLADLGKTAAEVAVPEADDTPYAQTPFWEVTQGDGRKWLDFQNDVHTKDVRLAAKENYASVEHMKRYTTQGMATDQGKSSNVAALAVLADATGRSIPETGTTTFRPPFTPVPIGAMGSAGRGKGFAPERLTPSHTASKARGAPMIEAGLWYRPSYFPAPGETTWRESCDREVEMVRSKVGVADVSTLGKIDVQGPNAGAFLDLVYANMMSTLKPGRVRYGIMLREDGYVMDDGTCSCWGDGRYLVTTTTAAAGPVMVHMEHARQVLRPDLDVQIASATDAWAQFAVTGPLAREVLNTLLDIPTDDETLTYMGCAEVRVLGVAGRLYRISFSGELGYEIAVPAAYGPALYGQLVAVAEGLGGGAYGMEALNVLRLEKGFLTHAEMHGRVTAGDLGMGRMLSKKKDFIGRAAAGRPGLVDADRETLVGLRPVNPDQDLTAGAHLFNQDAAATRENDQGYVTSVGHSTTFGHAIALGFLRRGAERLGEKVMMVDHLRGIDTLCEVTVPGGYDPEGGRLRG